MGLSHQGWIPDIRNWKFFYPQAVTPVKSTFQCVIANPIISKWLFSHILIHSVQASCYL